jgi:putative hydrolase of the HAD superfamily
VSEAYALHAQRFGIHKTQDEIAALFRQAFARQEQLDQRAGNTTSEPREELRWRQIVGTVFPESPDPSALFDALWQHFADPASWSLFEDVAFAWPVLAERGLQLAVASNFDRRLVSICQGLPPLDRGSRVFISSQLGVRKPDRAFFALVQAELALEPGEIVMVGDDLTNDYRGATAAGWRAVLLDRQQANDQPPPHRLTTLRDLPAWLDGQAEIAC